MWIPSLAAIFVLAWFAHSSRRARQNLQREMQLLAASEKRYRAIVEASPHSIQTLDANGHCLSVNERGLQILGLHQDQLLGQPLINHWPTAMRPVLSSAFQRVLRGQLARLDTLYVRPDGEERFINVTLNPTLNRDGQIENVICIAIDLTEQKRVELEAFNAKHAAEAATQAKSEFLAIVSHEIRTPLGGVIGMLELLSKQEQTALQSRYTTLAHDNAQALVELLNDILDHSKATAGRLALEAIPFRPRLELARAIECQQTRALAKGLKFTWMVAGDVPEFLQGDPTRLRQAICNLLSNAIKFTSQGSISVEVRPVAARKIDRRALSIRISDTGPGISAEAQKRLFSKYEQADSTTSRFFGGSGLGLVIVKQIAELMNGDIEVSSQPGQGTTFHLTAEFDVPAPDVIEAISVQPRPLSIPAPTHRLRVLCADDEPINQIIAEGFVRGFGHEIEFAADGEEAVAKLCEKDFDVVFMDSRMPRLNGIEATERIRSRDTKVRDHGVFIAATTADTSSVHREKCFSSGMNRFLVKPFHEADLALLLQDVITCQLARGRPLPEINDLPPKIEAPANSTSARDVAPSAPGLSESELLAMLDSAEAAESPAPSLKPEIILQYLRDAPARFAQMRAALRDRDHNALGIAAHSIKSISFYVSAHSLCELGREIERSADLGKFDEAERLLEKAESAFTEVRRQLTRSSYEALVS